ncbi:vicilin-like seed storage protein At2g18540 [Anabas testudineus]|uniref:vicilin-like seed storage protein At2g18540 n=1 Tax=Anabas testudineus TaxID=64144 RepID=UPI000E456C6F|nr:vicilin-like seed storage protein At2g18540 [Anabas testudineus]
MANNLAYSWMKKTPVIPIYGGEGRETRLAWLTSFLEKGDNLIEEVAREDIEKRRRGEQEDGKTIKEMEERRKAMHEYLKDWDKKREEKEREEDDKYGKDHPVRQEARQEQKYLNEIVEMRVAEWMRRVRELTWKEEERERRDKLRQQIVERETENLQHDNRKILDYLDFLKFRWQANENNRARRQEIQRLIRTKKEMDRREKAEKKEEKRKEKWEKKAEKILTSTEAKEKDDRHLKTALKTCGYPKWAVHKVASCSRKGTTEQSESQV